MTIQSPSVFTLFWNHPVYPVVAWKDYVAWAHLWLERQVENDTRWERTLRWLYQQYHVCVRKRVSESRWDHRTVGWRHHQNRHHANGQLSVTGIMCRAVGAKVRNSQSTHRIVAVTIEDSVTFDSCLYVDKLSRFLFLHIMYFDYLWRIQIKFYGFEKCDFETLLLSQIFRHDRIHAMIPFL